ncbi:DUF3999 family protein [Dyella subtropica]|uniref:DUF3999 family protein n=1 Tax=Dyella subtropica TaxID=2992127 RepID=UPI00224FF375|nr:DUF3999 family protein [Dyella subtropica]
MRLDLRWILAASLLPLAAAHASSVTDYAYGFALDTKTGSEAYRVALSPAVYAVSRFDAGLRDIVVVNAQGRPVPFAPMPPAAPQVHAYSLKAKLLPLPASSADSKDGVRVERNANGDIVINQPSAATAALKPMQWLVDARRPVVIDHIDIDALDSEHDMEIQLAVEASDDLQQWDQRNEGATVVSVKRGEDAVDQRSIQVGGEPARYYRLRIVEGEPAWDSKHTPAVSLSGHYADPAADHAASLQWQTMQAETSSASGNGHDYDYQLPASLPLEAVRVTLPDANTAARFQLSAQAGEGGSASWSSLASITAVRVAGKTTADATFSPQRVQHLRLHTDTPLPQAPALAVAWLPDEFVFLAEGGGPYRLLAGSYAARRADYPVTAALDSMRATQPEGWQPPLAALGERSDAGGPQALAAPKVPYDWTKPLLWLVLVAGALAVGGMALSLLRQSKREDARP